MFIYVYITTQNQKARRANKAVVVLELLGEAKLKLISRKHLRLDDYQQWNISSHFCKL
jgi:hypothetical protein